MRHVAGVCDDGRIRLIEQPVPELRAGTVLVEVHASLVSPGTELGGWRRLAERREASAAPGTPRPFGYSNAGVVRAVGDGAAEFKPGDRVACIGNGYAQHADWAVMPHHLCVALPEPVTFAQGSYAMLAATAMHAMRRGQPEFGETTVVAGLGVLGQLTARVYQLAGNYVIGWDVIGRRIEIARKWGIDLAVRAGDGDEVERTRAFTNDYGLDAAVLALGGDASEMLRSIGRCMKKSPDGHPAGRIVVVGNPTFTYRDHESAGMTNIDIRRASRTGPGYHDAAWEFGPAYPPVFMRWTTRTNLALCMRLIAEGKLDVDVLTTHRIPLADVEAGVNAILDRPDELLGVVFEKG
jgi:threonine dehydrogenase-like Zn-dependent dehydrogenase